MLIRPDDIDDYTVPIPAPHVAIVKVDDGGLLVDEEAGRGYPVNATASLVWTLLETMSPIGELINDLCGVFEGPRSSVASSVHSLVRTFGELGLFENVRRNLASIPIDIEYADLDYCAEQVPAESGDDHPFDARYLPAPPNG